VFLHADLELRETSLILFVRHKKAPLGMTVALIDPAGKWLDSGSALSPASGDDAWRAGCNFTIHPHRA
jgi:hypothetical protein